MKLDILALLLLASVVHSSRCRGGSILLPYAGPEQHTTVFHRHLESQGPIVVFREFNSAFLVYQELQQPQFKYITSWEVR